MVIRHRLRESSTVIIGGVGLIADTITIVGAIIAAHIRPIVSGTSIVRPALDVVLLTTLLIGLYSLTMIVWYLFRRRRLKQDAKQFGLDDIYELDPSAGPVYGIIVSLVPVIGPFFGMITLVSARNVFWLAFFIALLPTTLWLYLFTISTGVSCTIGLLGSFVLAQYATFFALVLDKFFESSTL
jgi:hypothetical protein